MKDFQPVRLNKKVADVVIVAAAVLHVVVVVVNHIFKQSHQLDAHNH